MPIIKKVQTTETIVCDKCGKETEIVKGQKLTDIVTFRYTEKNGLRLLEKKEKIPHYESFQIPNRKDIIFCSHQCAVEWLKGSTDLFLAEVKQEQHTIKELKRRKLESS